MTCSEQLEFQRLRMKESIIDYFTEELKINSDALQHYDKFSADPIQQPVTAEVARMREMEAQKLRDRVTQISRHIAVIKRMV